MRDFFWSKLEASWHKPIVGVSASLFAGLLALLTHGSFSIGEVSNAGWALGAATVAATLLIWCLTTRLPKAPKDCIGILVAVRKDAEHAKRIQSDFIDSFRRLIEEDSFSHRLRLVEYPAGSTRNILTRWDAARELTRARCQLGLFGQARLRQIRGEAVHVLDLNMILRHGPLPAPLLHGMRRVCGNLMPGRYLVQQDGDFELLELTSKWLDSAARLALGVLALSTGGVEEAERLLEDVRLKTAIAAGGGDPVARKLAERVREPLAVTLAARARISVDEFRESSDRAPLRRAETYAERVLAQRPGNYDAHLILSLCAFELRRDIKAARKFLKSCRGIKDSAWRLSEAFLHCYSGNFASARGCYLHAFRGRAVSDELLAQCESHIERVLSEEPSRVGLRFGLAMIRDRRGNRHGAASAAAQFLDVSGDKLRPRELDVMRTLAARVADAGKEASPADAAASQSSADPRAFEAA